MSIERITPGRGIWVKCDGTDETFCKEKRYTANIVPRHNRAHWKKLEGWGRGMRSHNKRHDLCPEHLKHEQDLVAKKKAEREEAKKRKTEERARKDAERAAKKAAKLAAKAAKSSPSAASAPVPAT